MWEIATKTINRQKKTIAYIQKKVYRLQKRIKSLNDLIDHLKQNNKISSDCHSILQV
jgi:archaellum component FlaC